ncbi:hypothetical protein D2V93_16510 [Flagellimonas taeanensis]|jgi:hypothetical protein|uniref:DUF7009 family protein n=1 Tax=Flavobacteriaceae TaxID=49546 RepID=UPI000E685CB2|nr:MULTISPECIES: hypothetical protein [Allomuricauda]MDC6383992.1 hypothetical protein [Muricauda sp. SK9]MEE1962066.1 hypothetical protein [Allomuricauda taeanensis]RIV48601.1 hypothetical protein D2V93_16510 [Allomuricauda taeanensis]
MKIRIKGNSVRFRLTQSEVKQLSETGSVQEITEFGTHIFQYRVQLMKGIQNLQAAYIQNGITLSIPETEGKNWFLTETVGFEHEMPLPEGKNLHLLLEKDFACLDNTSEDQSDNYPNPKSQC